MTRLERALGARARSTVSRPVDLVITDDWTTPALLGALDELRTDRARVPVVLVHDHAVALDRCTPAARARADANLAACDRFAQRYGARRLEGRGIQHFAVPEAGLVRPGMLVLGNDSHAATLGAYGVLALPAQPTTVAAALHTGRMLLRVPESLRVELVGALPPGSTARDAARMLLAVLRGPGVREHHASGRALEFSGPAVATLSLAERAVLANVAPEAVAVSSLFPVDEATVAFFERLGVEVAADAAEPPAAHLTLRLDLAAVEPTVGRSGDPADAVAVDALTRIRVDRVFVGTCAGGTFEEIAAFAEALGARAALPTVVAPASSAIRDRLRAAGVLERLEGAGVTLLPPGCGPCFGFGPGRAQEGEVVVSTGNRNSAGRMGAPDARIYLASGRTAGLAARTGAIGSGRLAARTARAAPRLHLWQGGNILRVTGTVTTDDITPSAVPGVGTSADGDPTVLRRLLFHHLAPGLHRHDLAGRVVVGDRDWGMGSNRASSVRALKAAGIAAVVARSIAPLYAAGARDEGFPVVALDTDAFFEALTPGSHVSVELCRGEVRLGDQVFSVPPALGVERSLFEAGGVVPYLRAGGTLSGRQ